MTELQFPEGFVWGAATAAYQIEGGAHEGGRGESIWDRFSHTPGKVSHGDTGDVACDHFHRYAGDVAMMRELGLGAYRFSVAWPRVQPSGKGPPHPAGLDFYSRLVDALLEAGIAPMATLYHWDLPQALQDEGGFASRDVAGWFADYAGVVARALGDRLRWIVTLNEPQIFGLFGYVVGTHAPGVQDFVGYPRVAHHINLAHGEAVRAVRAERARLPVGIAMQTPPMHPRSASAEDAAAARRFDAFFNRYFLDPVLLGAYPPELLELLSPLGVRYPEEDLAVIAQPLDFVGVNNYTRYFVRHHPETPLLEALADEHHRIDGARYTDMGWEIRPDALGEVLDRLRADYGNPVVYVTENGAAFADPVADGQVHDADRVAFLRGYLARLHRAIADGARVRGYFVWSWLDNFEWAHGYSKRFGLVHVDYPTQRRTPKDSARWYAEVARRNALSP
ncbi:MAG: beta-glucosidase [Polyangiaceae bacterium]|nr:beta-glucosidase [Polyangiaceae bacterium]